MVRDAVYVALGDESHPCLLPQMQPWESPHQNAAGCTKLQTWRTEEAPLGWGRLDHGPAADPILCSLKSGKAALSPADWFESPIESSRHSWRNCSSAWVA